jgi:hypothetical protein
MLEILFLLHQSRINDNELHGLILKRSHWLRG